MTRAHQSSLAHPLALIGVRTFASLVRQYGVDPGCRGKAAALLLSCGLGAPFRWLDAALSSRLVARTPLPHDPLFIIGHWRSGTTHLHNLITLDPRFGRLRAYLQDSRQYRKNTYSFDRGSVERVEREWGFALSRWGYDRPALNRVSERAV